MAFARVDLRNHRKIVVIDDAFGYTGSQNIADADFAPKKEFAPWIDPAEAVKAALPQEASVGEIFRGAIPYWFILFTVIVAIVIFPQIATFLPKL